MSARYVLVWDLDGTLGNFEALRRFPLDGPLTEELRIQVRPGLASALAALMKEGFTHTLLTLATPRYAEIALRSAGLRDCFELVEGLGQRGKGDAEGVGAALGLPPEERGDRMLFVGDHPLYDAPRDPRVLFHLEPHALLRSAADVVSLVLHLRARGDGSLRAGFDRVVGRAPWWRRLLRRSGPIPEPVQRTVEGLGELVLVPRPGDCPVIAFAGPPESLGEPTVHAVPHEP
jgi:hypothetical protein